MLWNGWPFGWWIGPVCGIRIGGPVAAKNGGTRPGGGWADRETKRVRKEF